MACSNWAQLESERAMWVSLDFDYDEEIQIELVEIATSPLSLPCQHQIALRTRDWPLRRRLFAPFTAGHESTHWRLAANSGLRSSGADKVCDDEQSNCIFYA